jgi:transcription initiation factor TFIIIB Brf1 subunit/transcription initiation factor TFIIB
MCEQGCGQREACRVCGSSEWLEGHFVNGAIVCLACWREIERSQRRSPPRPQTFNLAQATQREGVARA